MYLYFLIFFRVGEARAKGPETSLIDLVNSQLEVQYLGLPLICDACFTDIEFHMFMYFFLFFYRLYLKEEDLNLK